MAAESRVYYELFAMVWFGELEEEDALYQTSIGQRGCGKKKCEGRLTDERSYMFETRRPMIEVLSSWHIILTSIDENLCFIASEMKGGCAVKFCLVMIRNLGSDS